MRTIVLIARAPFTRRADLVLRTYMHDWERRIALERVGGAPYADTRVVADPSFTIGTHSCRPRMTL